MLGVINSSFQLSLHNLSLFSVGQINDQPNQIRQQQLFYWRQISFTVKT